MKKVTVICAHCGGMFQTSIPTTGVSQSAHHHSPGCGKTTWVHVNTGNIVKTTK